MKRELTTIGWREWISLPELGIDRIKAKVDTGARTSALHAFDLSYSQRGGKDFVKFIVHPNQDSSQETIVCETELLEFRKVKSSNGKSESRPVILTQVQLLGETWPIEVTLTNRDAMGFRMLLGRHSIKKKFAVDPGSSFYNKI